MFKIDLTPELALQGTGLHNHVKTFRQCLIYGFIFLYTDFTLMALQDCLCFSFSICCKSQKVVFGSRAAFQGQLEICPLLYTLQNICFVSASLPTQLAFTSYQHSFPSSGDLLPIGFLYCCGEGLIYFLNKKNLKMILYPSCCPYIKKKI